MALNHGVAGRWRNGPEAFPLSGILRGCRPDVRGRRTGGRVRCLSFPCSPMHQLRFKNKQKLTSSFACKYRLLQAHLEIKLIKWAEIDLPLNILLNHLTFSQLAFCSNMKKMELWEANIKIVYQTSHVCEQSAHYLP